MPSSSHKKVILRRFRPGGQTDILPGYLAVSGFVRNRALDLLDLSGRVVPILLNDLKLISYVRDFNLNDTVNPERLTRRTFLARPRSEGLWLRLSFTSGDLLEGLAPTDHTLLDDLVNDAGLFLTPPDIRSNTQRIFVPRTSIAELTLLAVITSPSKKKPGPLDPGTMTNDQQQDLFSAELPPNARPN
ncbi:hypothetical protein [Granulicella sp. dw_53]|uniref:DUF6982 domain-containing protein n=1 Tax=Granulicella sp. dw_53 TaxID=2719792 RepID=UPI001BD5964E|nr:hypothetical protein [Granulicella sp. dw_53]